MLNSQQHSCPPADVGLLTVNQAQRNTKSPNCSRPTKHMSGGHTTWSHSWRWGEWAGGGWGRAELGLCAGAGEDALGGLSCSRRACVCVRAHVCVWEPVCVHMGTHMSVGESTGSPMTGAWTRLNDCGGAWTRLNDFGGGPGRVSTTLVGGLDASRQWWWALGVQRQRSLCHHS